MIKQYRSFYHDVVSTSSYPYQGTVLYNCESIPSFSSHASASRCFCVWWSIGQKRHVLCSENQRLSSGYWRETVHFQGLSSLNIPLLSGNIQYVHNKFKVIKIEALSANSEAIFPVNRLSGNNGLIKWKSEFIASQSCTSDFFNHSCKVIVSLHQHPPPSFPLR